MRISDWSSDVCSSDLSAAGRGTAPPRPCPALPAGCRVTDPFGDPLHTARQRAYAARLRLPTIYTPQMVIDGIDQVEIGRAACRERVCQYVEISVVSES